MKGMRHIADILRPGKTLTARGRSNGAEETFLRNIPCSVNDLSGSQAEQAHKLYADATVQVEMYGDPDKPLQAADVLLVNGKRRLAIGHVNDLQQNGVSLRLLCSEVRS